LPYTHADRLTALDSAFLDLESDGVHMHVGSIGIFDAGPLTDPDGSFDFERVLAMVDAGLARVPRFRQKLEDIPVAGGRVWIDDEHFNARYHVRHTCLPLPGDERQLKRLAGRIMSQKLDTTKPLWELWLVEGVGDDRMAVISKIHHCMIDGLSGVDLLAAFMGPDPEHRIETPEYRWMPRPAPSPGALAREETWRRITSPSRAAVAAARSLGRASGGLSEGAHAISGFVEALGKSLTPASETPFNCPIGPHRRFDWTRFDLGVVREVKQKLGGTVNDVVLACVAGAVRGYLEDHAVETDEIDFRAFVPVSTRRDDERGKLGNRVSMIVAGLPVSEPDPRRRLQRVSEETTHAKESGQAAGNELMEELSDWTSGALIRAMSRLAAQRRAYNIVVTNVPGPPLPVFMSGARMLESYPLVPLFENQALGIALFSYDGSLYWGFNADWDAIPDLHEFVQGIEREFEILRKL